MTKKSQSTTKKTSRKGKSGSSIAGFLVVILFLCGLFIADRLGIVKVDWAGLLNGKNVAQPGSGGPPPAPQAGSNNTPAPVVVAPVTGEWYKLYFSTPSYPDNPAGRRETIMTGLIEVINGAQRSLDIAIYELNLDPVGDALLAARDRGVNVRLVTDSDSLADDATLKRLKKAKIPIVPDERGAIMHDKFVVVDGQAVWTGSWNFTINDTYRNNNNAIYIQSPQLAADYAAEFDEMFSQQAFGPTSPANTAYPQVQVGDTLIQVCFAAEDGCANQLIKVIGEAQQSIRFMAFSFTQAGIGQAVMDRAKAGVAVQGVFETRGSETEFSELAVMKKRKLDVWQDGNPYTLHHKVFIIDEQTVVFGSFNFSDNADGSNDENMLVLHNPAIASQFLAEFNRVYAQAQNAK